MMMMATTTTTMTGCPCAVNAVGGGAITGNGNTIGSSTGSMGGNSGGAYSDDATTSNAETLLSSNAKFQAISAIAVTQDGVINVADQGGFLMFYYWNTLLPPHTLLSQLI